MPLMCNEKYTKANKFSRRWGEKRLAAIALPLAYIAAFVFNGATSFSTHIWSEYARSG